MKIGVFTTDQARLLWQDYLTRMRSTPAAQRHNRPPFPMLAVILDEELAPCPNPKYPTSALARLQQWSTTVQVWTLVISGSPSGGSYDITIEGDDIAAQTIEVNHTDNATAIQALIRALTGAGLAATVVGTTGSSPNFTHTIEFFSSDKITVTVDDTGLTGGTSPEVKLRHNTVGYVETQTQITVWSHAAKEYPVNTFGMTKFCDGHHWFFGDCDPMPEAQRTELED